MKRPSSNDPTYPGTDHTREYVPLLITGDHVPAGVNLGVRNSFADIAATIADVFEVKRPLIGQSFKSMILP